MPHWILPQWVLLHWGNICHQLYNANWTVAMFCGHVCSHVCFWACVRREAPAEKGVKISWHGSPFKFVLHFVRCNTVTVSSNQICYNILMFESLQHYFWIMFVLKKFHITRPEIKKLPVWSDVFKVWLGLHVQQILGCSGSVIWERNRSLMEICWTTAIV